MKKKSTLISWSLDESYTLSTNPIRKQRKKYTKAEKKLRIKSRTYFKHRNLIKKVKTNSINLYEKIINTCLKSSYVFSLSNVRNKRRRDVLRYFKSDISKLRNYLLLEIPMKHIISLISDFQFDSTNIIDAKKEKLALLLNMTWKEYILSIKNEVGDIIDGVEVLLNKLTNDDYDIFFKYVLETNYSYDLRPNVDNLYVNSLEKILEFTNQPQTEEMRQIGLLKFVKSFRKF